jgi:2',3'-cyclic-nucleotide 2'-phosphodiesterase
MKILFIGDISGSPGREAVKEILPKLKKEKKIDFVIANCENAAGGRGITREVMNELQSYGVDFFTSGEHVWGIKGFLNELEDESLPLVRPLNYEGGKFVPGSGYKEIELGSNGKLVVISLIGQVFMREPARSPFWVIDELLDNKLTDWENAVIIVDFHAEATSEKVSLGYYLKNKITAMFGTHTHVGTIDTRLFDGTGFVTDVGMVGPYDASLWVKFDKVIHNFKYPYKKAFEMEEEGGKVFNSILITTSEEKSEFGIKKCKKIERIDKYLE